MPENKGLQYRKLFFIHGFQSSPSSTKAKILQKEIGAIPLKYRDVPAEKLVISDCLQRINQAVNKEKEVWLIGSSLGGFLAAASTLVVSNISKLWLLNPAIIPPNTDITKIDSMPKRILSEMLLPELFSRRLKPEVIIFRGTKDMVVPDAWVLEFARFQEATVYFIDDDHRFSMHLTRIVEIIQGYLEERC